MLSSCIIPAVAFFLLQEQKSNVWSVVFLHKVTNITVKRKSYFTYEMMQFYF